MYSNDVKLKALQEKTLLMAQEIVDFCGKNDILCYFCGGGAIGAVREGGFIPWDDDLDFFMPRKDYERFYVLWSSSTLNSKFPVQRATKNYNDHNSFTTVRDPQTTFIKTYQQELDICHGITIDIFPLDIAPVSEKKRKRQKMWALVYALFCSQVIPENHGGLMATGAKVLLSIFSLQGSRYKIWKFAEKQMTKYNDSDSPYITELCVGPKYMGNIYHKEDFTAAKFFKFEDTLMPLPIGYDRYLRKAFGNYMERPDKENQKTIHDSIYIDPDTSYTEYKHIHYLTKEEIEK